MAAADVEVVEGLRRRDLHRAGALLGVGVRIGDDGDRPADQRQPHALADEMRVALVLRMHGDAGIAEHRLRPRRGDDDVLAGRLAGPVHHRIAEVPEVALRLDLLHLDVGDGGEQLRVPVDQPLVAVDQPLAVQRDEHLAHRVREALVHGEALARPVARGAEPAQLVDDGAARLRLPLPHALEEFLAPHRAAAGLLALGELAFHHHLRGDAGVVGAGLPEHVAPAHPLEAAEDVLQRVVERVPHVQHAGDVRRRDDDGEGLCAGAPGAARLEGAGLFPDGGNARLDGGGVEGLVHDTAR